MHIYNAHDFIQITIRSHQLPQQTQQRGFEDRTVHKQKLHKHRDKYLQARYLQKLGD